MGCVMISDLELLDVEIDTLWLKDERNRLVEERRPNGLAAPHLVIAVSNAGWALALGSEYRMRSPLSSRRRLLPSRRRPIQHLSRPP
jgi:hypothetical protein